MVSPFLINKYRNAGTLKRHKRKAING